MPIRNTDADLQRDVALRRASRFVNMRIARERGTFTRRIDALIREYQPTNDAQLIFVKFSLHTRHAC